MDLDAIELILKPAIAAAGWQFARIKIGRHALRFDGHAPGRWSNERLPARHRAVGCDAIGAADIGQHPHLPHGLHACGGIHPHGVFHQIGLLEMGKLALPNLEIGEVRPATGQGRRRRKIRLLVVRQRRFTAQLGQHWIELRRAAAVIFR